MPASGRDFNSGELNISATQVYVYRPSQFNNKGLIYYVYLDGKEIGKLRDGGYVKADATSGTHTIKVVIDRGLGSTMNLQRSITIAANHKIFLKIASSSGMTGSDAAITGLGIASSVVTGIGATSMHTYGEIVVVPSSNAIKELSGLRQSS